MIEFTGIRLMNVRAFEGEHFVPLGRGLTVLMGRNNAGKSTVARVPFLFLRPARAGVESGFCRDGTEQSLFAFQLRLPAAELERLVGFAVSRLGDINFDIASGTSTSLAARNEFAGWQHAPLLELGWLFNRKAHRHRTLRLVSPSSDRAWPDRSCLKSAQGRMARVPFCPVTRIPLALTRAGSHARSQPSAARARSCPVRS